MITKNIEIKTRIKFPHLFKRDGEFKSKFKGAGILDPDCVYLYKIFKEKARARCVSMTKYDFNKRESFTFIES